MKLLLPGHGFCDKQSLFRQKCVVAENIHTHPKEGYRNSKGERGLKSQSFKGKYGTKMKFPEGVGGLKLKYLPWEGYGYFLEQHNTVNRQESQPCLCQKPTPRY